MYPSCKAARGASSYNSLMSVPQRDKMGPSGGSLGSSRAMRTLGCVLILLQCGIANGSQAVTPCLATPAAALVREVSLFDQSRGSIFHVPASQREAHPPDDLVSALFLTNYARFEPSEVRRFLRLYPNHAAPPEVLRIEEMRMVSEHPVYPTFKAEVWFKAPGQPNHRQTLHFRSNGRAAFLHGTWKESQQARDQSFYATFLKQDGTTGWADQTELVLESMPHGGVLLSRVMSAKEALHWKKGSLRAIRSNPFARLIEPGGFRSRVTFALNHYRFQGHEPFTYQVERDLLLSLKRKGHLVANTYSSYLEDLRTGMPPEARAPFGLEFEIVLLDAEGKEAASQFMKRPRTEPRSLSSNVAESFEAELRRMVESQPPIIDGFGRMFQPNLFDNAIRAAEGQLSILLEKREAHAAEIEILSRRITGLRGKKAEALRSRVTPALDPDVF